MVLKASGYPPRCEEYWQRYYLLLEKCREFSEAQKAGVNISQLERDVQIILDGIKQHFRCCKQCHDWFWSFSK